MSRKKKPDESGKKSGRREAEREQRLQALNELYASLEKPRNRKRPALLRDGLRRD